MVYFYVAPTSWRLWGAPPPPQKKNMKRSLEDPEIPTPKKQELSPIYFILPSHNSQGKLVICTNEEAISKAKKIAPSTESSSVVYFILPSDRSPEKGTLAICTHPRALSTGKKLEKMKKLKLEGAMVAFWNLMRDGEDDLETVAFPHVIKDLLQFFDEDVTDLQPHFVFVDFRELKENEATKGLFFGRIDDVFKGAMDSNFKSIPFNELHENELTKGKFFLAIPGM